MEACRATAEPGFWYSGSAGLDLCNSRYPRKSSVPTAFKRAKKIKKKLVRPSRLPLKGNSEATNALILSFKKNQKK
ncbi:MAG: hypothetical protein DMF00_02245 [Verrucomicrobia bacterium]|nr:MAG: hypothetical protein DMF00_02245 [Verrucomicrobiota bacterium]